ncbi:MAG: competence/damage-inducible protein A [candidate division Zixibacteria bacterium]|nr:competence/damage-inducible protein A [candidate division Zixibacteria bacterium]
MPLTVEIITIGDEILTGHTIDTNAAWLAAELTAAGLSVVFQSSVGDDLDAMEAVFRQAQKRAQIVIATGGLGPTDDDITKRAIVKVFKRNLVYHEQIFEDIKKRYAARGVVLPAINQNQALLPQGAKFFPNKLGSAVGICIAEQGHHFVALPGVPREMKQIFTDEVLPYLRTLEGGQAISIIKLRATGVSESKLAELIQSAVKLEPGVRLGYLPNYGGVDLRILATGVSQSEADQKAVTLAERIEAQCATYVYGRNDDTLERVIGRILEERKMSLAVAESCTGGELGMLITSVPGSSTYFLGGVQAYSNAVKEQLLGVPAELLQSHGAVSEECAIAMAQGVRNLLVSNYALSVAGIAGPDGGSDAKPVGTTWIGLAGPNGAYARHFRFGVDRPTNRTRATAAALELLRRDLLSIV